MRLINHVADLTTLTEAWRRLYAGKSDDVRDHSQGIDEESLTDFEKNAGDNLRTISDQLLKGTYSLLSLSGFTEPKKDGNFRLITAPCVRDRIVHAAILNIIQKYFPEIRNGSSYCLPRTKQKSEKVNFIDAFKILSKHIKNGNAYVFESDIESFFDRIVKKQLFETVIFGLPDNSINGLLEKIIYFKIGNMEEFKDRIKRGKINKPEKKTGLSQGSPLSPLFANIYLNKFDITMIRQFKTRYIRYVDDFIVICPTNIETIQAHKIAIKSLKGLGLTLPPDVDAKSKTRTSIDLRNGDEFVFLGIKVSKDDLRPNLSDPELKNYIDKKCFTAKSIRMVLKNKKKPSTNGAKEEIINAKIQSKFGVYGYFHTKDTLRLLNELISAKAKQAMLKIRLIEAKKKGMPIVSQNEWQSYFKQSFS